MNEAGAVLLEAHELGRRVERGWLFRGLELAIAAGECVALVGPSGSGKTLLLRALAGLEAFDEGRVTLLGRPQAAWAMPAYRATAMYLHQSPAFFEGTVEAALRQPFALAAHRRPFERAAALGLLAPFERGEGFLAQPVATLSGGERQLVALVRAQLGNPGLLILDEATSAVDPATERRITEALRRLSAGRTVITIAHRLSTAEGADKVFVFDAGQLVEEGTHAELAAGEGTYAVLYGSWLGNVREDGAA